LPAALLRLPDASQRAAFALVPLLEAFADARGESDDAWLARYILSAEATAPSHLAAGTRCACLLRGDPATLALWGVDAATQSHLLTLLRGGTTLSSAALPLASDAAPASMQQLPACCGAAGCAASSPPLLLLARGGWEAQGSNCAWLVDADTLACTRSPVARGVAGAPRRLRRHRRYRQSGTLRHQCPSAHSRSGSTPSRSRRWTPCQS
jgi:hypothetical protein